jgi:hypothetical protein
MIRTPLSSVALLALLGLLALGFSSGAVSVGDDRQAESGGGNSGAGGSGGDANHGWGCGRPSQPTAETRLGLLEPCVQLSNGLLDSASPEL